MQTTTITRKKALENLAAARFLRDRLWCDSSASRSYYSALQISAAFLLHHQQLPPRIKRSHHIVRTRFRELLNKKYPKHLKLADDLRTLESYRDDADYNENKCLSPKESQRCYELSSGFLNTILKLEQTL
jgi:uncharacterized protein (UPF0332 family)